MSVNIKIRDAVKKYGDNTAYWVGSEEGYTVKFDKDGVQFMALSYGLTEGELDTVLSGLIETNTESE